MSEVLAERQVLNSGFVKLVDKMGNDYSILRAARVSTGAETSKGEKKDKGLIDFLYRNDHISPFSFVSFQFYIKCPLFVARQWMRHRSFDYNEASARYKEFEWDVWVPESFRIQGGDNKQGSLEVEDEKKEELFKLKELYGTAKETYEDLLENEIAREQARAVMPMGQYTEFFAHVNMRNLFHFLELRLDEHAQYEIRVYAEAILSILEELTEIEWSVNSFKKYRELKNLYNQALNISKKNFKSTNPVKDYLQDFIDTNTKE